MEKLLKKIGNNLSKPYLINPIDLIDFLLDIKEKVDEFDENFRCFQILKDIKDTDEEWFYSASQNELIIMFDSVRDATHNSGFLLEYFFPNLEKTFFDKLSE